MINQYILKYALPEEDDEDIILEKPLIIVEERPEPSFSRDTISLIKEPLVRPIPRTIPSLGIRPSLKDGRLTGRGKANIKRVYNEATAAEKDYWGNWYYNAQKDVKNLSNIFKIRFDVTAAIVAALSPGNKWVDNLIAAAKLIKGESIIHAYPDNIRKALEIKKTNIPKVSGPKVTVFYQSLIDPDSVKSQVVSDGHAINVWMGKKLSLRSAPSISKKIRNKIESDYIKAAEELGVSPQSVQAVTWYIWKCLPAYPAKTPPVPMPEI